ncbi:CBS domain-containing protein [Burkholderia sp. BCC1977]|uniref:CBS domain-containing protein n=1 Tax=Burkholderia sp. BCC1977 TaxID=2817440 RepID=UPI002ABDEAEE|nr:CBS domain-containing protein [Burkholderia sp. BCC1977]
MHLVNEIMSRDVVHVASTDTIRHAAQLMKRYDVGVLPVCDDSRLVGVVTDRDIVVRAVCAGKPPETRVHEVASGPIEFCFEDDALDEVQRYMATAQLHRLPVVDRYNRLVGMLSLGDIATRADTASRDEVANTLEGISQPERK